LNYCKLNKNYQVLANFQGKSKYIYTNFNSSIGHTIQQKFKFKDLFKIKSVIKLGYTADNGILNNK